MEYRLKEKRENGTISYQIQVKKRILFINIWIKYVREVSFFNELYIEEYFFDEKERALLEFRLLKDRTQELTIYHY